MNTSTMTERIKWRWELPLLAILICLGTIENVFSLLAFAICAVIIVCAPRQTGLCMMVFLMSFANIFKLSPGSQSFFTYLILLSVVCWAFVNRSISQRVLMLWALLLVYTAAQTFASFDVLRMVKFFANFLFIYYALRSDINESYKHVFFWYIFGVVCAAAVVALGLLPDIYSYIGEKNEFIGEVNLNRFAGMYGDPNYFAVNVIISLCLTVLLYHRGIIKALFGLALAAALVTFAIMTYSKSALLMLLLPLVLLLYSRIKNRRYFALAVVSVAAVVILLGALAGKFSFLDPILTRFDEASNVNDFTSGRSEIWRSYIDYFLENPIALFLGKGLGAPLVNGHGAHNTYIDVLYYLGLVGGVLLIALLFALSRCVANDTRKNLLNYSVLLTILVMYFFLSEIFYFDVAFHILLAIMAINLPLKNVRTGSFV